jgi:hypothetical protein
MSDDELRLRATVQDGFTGPLAKLRNELRNAGNIGTARAMDKDWKGVEKTVSSLVGNLKLGLAPVLRGIGVTSLGVGAGITGAVLGLRGFANSTRDLRIFSDQIGISVQRLREVKVLGEFFGMSWAGAQSSLKSFASNMDQMQRRVQAYKQLQSIGLSDLAEGLATSPDMATALDRTLDAIRKIPNLARRREVAAMLLGSDQWAVIASETTPKVRKQIHEMLKAFPQGNQEAAERFAVDMLMIKMRLENLRTQGFGPLLPEVDRFIEQLTKGGDSSALLKTIDVLRLALKEINDAVKWLSDNWPGEGKFGGVPKKGTLGDALGKGMKEGVGIGAIGGAIAGSVVPGPGTMAGAATGAAAGAFVGGAYEGGVFLYHSLIEEIKKLREAMEDANKNGALLQKESFTGGSFGGARVIPASLGVFGSGGGIRGGNAARGDAAAPGDYSGGVGSARGNAASWMEFAMRGNDKGGLGLSREQSAGVVGNLMAESGKGIPSWGPTGDGGTAWGSAQWRGDRLARLKRMFPDSYRTVEAQQKFMRWELEHSEKHALDALRRARTPEEAAAAVDRFYERSSGGARRQRQANARHMFNATRDGTSQGDAMLNRALPMPRPAPAEIRGNASIDINFNGLPGGSRIRSSASGLFREVNVSRGKPMQSVWDGE